MSIDKDMSEEDYLRRHLGDVEKGKKIENIIDSNIIEPVRVDELQYFNCDVRDLPCGKFYPTGTLIMVRPAMVKEIQAFSMVDDTNMYDIVEKMNYMLQECVRIKYPDGKIASFLNLKDQDRIYLIFLIRELTFQQGNNLSVPAKKRSGENVQIELLRRNFSFHEIDSSLDKFFDESERCYRFDVINGDKFEITPPTIGIQKAFTDYIIKENNEKRTPNLSFLKIIPFMLNGRNSITYEGIKAKLLEFETMNDISFQFINSAISKMTFGIKELKKVFEDGEEVIAEMQFPNGTSGIFVIHDAFEAYLKK